NVDAHLNLGIVLYRLNRFEEAVQMYDQALKLRPASIEALNNLAWAFATCNDPAIRNGTRAVKLAEQACELTRYDQVTFVGTLAAAYAEAGKFSDAVATAEKACVLASESGQQEALKKNQELLELYRSGKPY